VFQKRGKPGQTSAPTGQQLHLHATRLANLVLDRVNISLANHWQPIHERCVVEAFPNMFLCTLIDEPDLPVLSRDASDRYWEATVDRSSRLSALIGTLLPGRTIDCDLRMCTDHEERAGLICALTALCVVVGEHVAVGDPVDGDIVLPPARTWGLGHRRDGAWFETVLRDNVRAVRAAARRHPNHLSARVAIPGGLWF